MTVGRRRASMVPISGMVIWKSERTSSRKASNSSSARSISSMSRTTGSSEVIASSSGRRMRKSGPEELLLVDRALLRGADVQQLARVVPLVDGVGDVQPLVALKADQPGPAGAGQRLGQLGLADARLALQEQGLLDRQRQEDGRREAPLGQIGLAQERVLQVGDRLEARAARHPVSLVGH